MEVKRFYLILIITFQVSSLQAQEAKDVLYGRVIDRESAKPLPHIEVTIEGVSTFTEGDGLFEFAYGDISKTEGDTYTISFRSVSGDYTTLQSTVRLPRNSQGENKNRWWLGEFDLSNKPVISGIIKNKKGEPLEGISVTSAEFLDPKQADTSDVTGFFRIYIEDFEPGSDDITLQFNAEKKYKPAELRVNKPNRYSIRREVIMKKKPTSKIVSFAAGGAAALSLIYLIIRPLPIL